jgi:hypothetical protein
MTLILSYASMLIDSPVHGLVRDAWTAMRPEACASQRV